MTQPDIRRRELLLAGAGLLTAAALPPLAQAAASDAVILFDPDLATARDLALVQKRPGQSMLPLEGDAFRFWRDRLQHRTGSISGVTRWNEFLAISEAASDSRLRVKHIQHHPQVKGAMLVSWTLA